MTPRPDLAELAARTLSATPDEKRRTSASEEARAVALVAAAIRRRRQREIWLRRTIGGVAAAAAIVLAVGVVKRRAAQPQSSPTTSREVGVAAPARAMVGVVDSVVGEAFVLHGGQSHSVIEGSNVGAGDQVVVQRAANVTFVLPTGTRVRVEEGGDVTVVAQGATQLFRLEAGSVRADVQKLVKGERFVIRTLDAEIEVRGTSFRVANVTSDPTCGAGTTTRLSVYEGVVTVRAGSTETSVPAGATWPADCSSALSADERSRPKPSSHDVQRPLTPAGPSPGALQSASARSQLAEQNDLYGKAIAFRESGDYATAITTFEKLAAKYPSSPLAENAVAERMKLLATMGSGRAAEAARDYIVRYPSGFARADAETILSRGGSDR